MKPLEPWAWRSNDVLKHLSIGPYLLASMMRVTLKAAPKGYDPPWVDIGAGGRPVYRWRPGEVDAWARRVLEWRASGGRGTHGTSRGDGPEVDMEPNGPTPAPTGPPPSRSARRSTGASRSDETGARSPLLAKMADLGLRSPS